MFENNQFNNCKNIKVIYLNECQEIKKYIDASLKNTIAIDSSSQESIIEEDNE